MARLKSVIFAKHQRTITPKYRENFDAMQWGDVKCEVVDKDEYKNKVVIKLKSNK